MRKKKKKNRGAADDGVGSTSSEEEEEDEFSFSSYSRFRNNRTVDLIRSNGGFLMILNKINSIFNIFRDFDYF